MPLESTMKFSRKLTDIEREDLGSLSDYFFIDKDGNIDPLTYFDWEKLDNLLGDLREIYREARHAKKKLSINGYILGKKGEKENNYIYCVDREKSFVKITCKKKETKSQDIYATCSKISISKQKNPQKLEAYVYRMTPEESKKMHRKVKAKDYILEPGEEMDINDVDDT